MIDTFESEKIFHIYNRANGEEKLFRSEDNYIFFLDKYKNFLSDKLETLAYCLLPNHYHFLVKINPGCTNEQIVKSFSDFQNSYSKSFNKVFSRKGALFQRKFKRKKIDSDEYLNRIIIYIHQNPIKHNLTKNIHDWKYSSFNTFLSEKPTHLKRELVLEWLGGIEGFKTFHQSNAELYLPEKFQLE